MLKNSLEYSDKKLLLYLILIFVVTEIIDTLLDYVFGNSLIHSFIQLFLFIILFFVIFRLFSLFFRKKINYLIPNNLKRILVIIQEYEIKGTLINQTVLMNKLNITKPTMKKRLQNLSELGYISIETKGNHKYIILTKKGISIIN